MRGKSGGDAAHACLHGGQGQVRPYRNAQRMVEAHTKAARIVGRRQQVQARQLGREAERAELLVVSSIKKMRVQIEAIVVTRPTSNTHARRAAVCGA